MLKISFACSGKRLALALALVPLLFIASLGYYP
jgi:hypothetical protein